MFPLKQRVICGYSFGQKTYYSDHHLGTDYKAYENELYAPFDGVIDKEFKGTQEGNCIWFRPDGQDVTMRFMHLKEFKASGRVKEGQLIAITGDTGMRISPTANNYHLHLDIYKGYPVHASLFENFIDPEKFNWEGEKVYEDSESLRVYLVGNKKIYQGKDEYPTFTCVISEPKQQKLLDITEKSVIPLPYEADPQLLTNRILDLEKTIKLMQEHIGVSSQITEEQKQNIVLEFIKSLIKKIGV